MLTISTHIEENLFLKMWFINALGLRKKVITQSRQKSPNLVLLKKKKNDRVNDIISVERRVKVVSL